MKVTKQQIADWRSSNPEYAFLPDKGVRALIHLEDSLGDLQEDLAQADLELKSGLRSIHGC